MSLRAIAYGIGLLMVLVGLPAVVNPSCWRRAMEAFPRSEKPAWFFTAIDLLWVAYIVLHAQLGRFDVLKPLIYVLTPVSFFLLIKFLDELLAPRALGGLMLLAATPIFNAARWHDSDWRFVVTVWTYGIVIVGILLVLNPYRFRQMASFWMANNERCRMGGAMKVVFGIAVLFLAYRFY